MHLTKEDRGAIWRAGNNGGWPGVYRAGFEAGVKRAQIAIIEWGEKSGNERAAESIAKMMRTALAAED